MTIAQNNQFQASAWYLELPPSSSLDNFTQWVVFIILFNTVVPIRYDRQHMRGPQPEREGLNLMSSGRNSWAPVRIAACTCRSSSSN